MFSLGINTWIVSNAWCLLNMAQARCVRKREYRKEDKLQSNRPDSKDKSKEPARNWRVICIAGEPNDNPKQEGKSDSQTGIHHEYMPVRYFMPHRMSSPTSDS
ncbi:hypothetical protein VTL71DRAFT_16561 [Oculimacula yallundae]|uniref:Uncharacterized protein n=1 Tax=Oculimacula yallundae TaxID=86028 RepID=A0ABR4CET0_9HELO